MPGFDAATYDYEIKFDGYRALGIRALAAFDSGPAMKMIFGPVSVPSHAVAGVGDILCAILHEESVSFIEL